MAATMTKRQEKSRTNYNAVLDTSIVLFNKKGYKDTTIKDICEATGLSNGSVYHLFRNKDDILRHIYERDINISIGLTQDLEQKVQDPYHYLLNFMLDIQRLWEKTGPMLLSNKSHSPPRVPPWDAAPFSEKNYTLLSLWHKSAAPLLTPLIRLLWLSFCLLCSAASCTGGSSVTTLTWICMPRPFGLL